MMTAALFECDAIRAPEIAGMTMALLYGSETGNSEELAIELGKMAERLHFWTDVEEMDSFKLKQLLSYTLVIFVISTTGDGELPRNGANFWRNLLRSSLNATNCLGKLRFAIFGLGDSSYPKFNWASRKLRGRLLQLGASEFFRAAEADERHENGTDSVFLPWLQELRQTLVADFLPQTIQAIPDDVLLPPKVTVRIAHMAKREQNKATLAACLTHATRSKTQDEVTEEERRRLRPDFPAHEARADDVWERRERVRVNSLDRDNVLKDYPQQYGLIPGDSDLEDPPGDILPMPGLFRAWVDHAERITSPDHFQDVRHLIFRVRLDGLTTESSLRGAVVAIRPKNYPKDAARLIELQGWDNVADLPIEWVPSRVRNPSATFSEGAILPRAKMFPKENSTLRDLLLHNLDITAIPKRRFLREIAHFATSQLEKGRLLELVSPSANQEFYDYCSRPRRTIIEVLQDFPSVKIPFERCIDLFPIMHAREYSIANGGGSFDLQMVKDPDTGKRVHFVTVEIVAALVQYKTLIKKPRQGLCSRYLKHLRPGMELGISLLIPQGKHRLQIVKDKTLHRRPLIAVATGTGVAPVRALVQDRLYIATKLDDILESTLLFFGCRSKDADYHFGDFWLEVPNMEVFPAFSRDPDHYVDERGEFPTTRPDVEIRAGTAAQAEYDSGKNYVQHLIRKHYKRVGEDLRQRPLIIIAGSSGKMPESVQCALQDVLVMNGLCENRERAWSWLQMEDNCLFWQETW